MNPVKFAPAAILLFALAGCVGGLKVTKTFQDPSYFPGQVKQGATVRIVIADNVDLRDFSSFQRRFLEMAGVSLGVAGVSFLIGLLMRKFLGVNV